MSGSAILTKNTYGRLDETLVTMRGEVGISVAAEQYLNLRRIDGKKIKKSEIDLEFTKRMSLFVRGLDKSFENVVILVKKSLEDVERGCLGIEIQPDIQRDSENLVIEFNELKTTKFIERILQSREIGEFREGIKLLINHEIGHAKAVGLGLKKFELGNVELDVGQFEPLAHIYALGKTADPVGAMASASAICHVVENTELVEDTVREWLEHLYFGITVKNGDTEEVGPVDSFLEMKTKSFVYLRRDVEREIIDKTSKLLAKLEGIPY
ncbi:MAG: hypothetical protein KGH65_00970 [Candidatus Micrarchaeota archaeon]|nr:hypothetical protein [Candidatus Micrarchaeota archaeon]